MYLISADVAPANEKDSKLLATITITTPHTSSKVAVKRADRIADNTQYLSRE
jgi:hypothetical protein